MEIKKVKLTGVGYSVPQNIVTNFDLEKMVDTSNEWIYKRTGILERRIAKGDNTIFHSKVAAEKALKESSIKAEDLELIIVCTLTPDNIIPSTACSLQKELGADKALCFDLSAACSGFIYGLDVASSMIKTGRFKNALVIGAETLSKVVDFKDRNTCILFGDGAGAAVLEESYDGGILNIYDGSDGTLGHNLTLSFNNGEENFVKMNGKEIFKFAVNIIPHCINEVLKGTGINLSDINLIIPHQANARIVEATSKKVNLPIEKFYTNLDRFGNTSAASIPLALACAYEDGKVKKGDLVILVGFGGGLTYGAVLLRF